MKRYSDPGFDPTSDPNLRDIGSRVEVDQAALAHNIRAIHQFCGPDLIYMAVVKANAYGHGAVQAARIALKNGAGFLGVARFSEALELRGVGINAPILLFGDILPAQAVWAAGHDVRITLATLETARAVSEAARDAGVTVKAHIKVDTGMGRLGFPAGVDLDRAVENVIEVFGLAHLDMEGIYTHFASADDPDKSHTKRQLIHFLYVLESLEAKGIRFKLTHAANSAAALSLPESRFDMIRPGIAMYGLWPSPDMAGTGPDLKPVLSIKTRVIQLKQVPKGFAVSYGSTWTARKPTTIATVAIGYADGYSRQLSSKGVMLVRGRRAPVVGRVCMDFTMLDVGHIPGVSPGDEVVALGAQGTETVSADELAQQLDTINYEITAGLTSRMPIHYIED